MKHYGDITKINGALVESVDIITGGSPCQDLSVAGKRAGLDGERSGLFMEQIRIIKEMRNECIRQIQMRGSDEPVRPRFMVWENVPGAFSSNGGEDFRIVLEETAKVADEGAVIPRPSGGKWTSAGCVMGDGWSIAWRVHDAQFWGKTYRNGNTGNVLALGTPQRRRRIALVADFGGGCAPEILFERKGVSGNIEPSEQKGEETAGAVGTDANQTGANSYTLKVRGGREFDRYGKRAGKGALIQTELSATLGVSQDQTLITNVSTGAATDPHHVPCICLEGNGSRESHQGNGYKESETMYTLNTVEQHGVCYGISAFESNSMKSSNPNSGIYEADTSRTLDLNGGSPACNQGGMMVVQGINGEVATTLDANYHKGCGERENTEREVVCVGNGQVMQTRMSDRVGALNCMHDQQAVMVYGLDRASFNQGQNAQYDFSVEKDLAQTVLAKGPGGVLTQQ